MFSTCCVEPVAFASPLGADGFSSTGAVADSSCSAAAGFASVPSSEILREFRDGGDDMMIGWVWSLLEVIREEDERRVSTK